MFQITRDSAWERIQHEGVSSLTAEGKIMVKIRRSFFSDSECSEFLRFAAEKVYQRGVPCYGKRATRETDNLPDNLKYHHTFLFYAKNRFDAVYVNRALTDALFYHPKTSKEVLGESKIGHSRAVTMRTKWKTDLESERPNEGFRPDNGKTEREVRKVMEFLVRKNPDVTDVEIAALLAFNDYCPILTCDLLLHGFFGIEDGLEVISPILFERFSTSLARDCAFFDLTPNINFMDLLHDLSEVRFIVPPDMKQPSDGPLPPWLYS